MSTLVPTPIYKNGANFNLWLVHPWYYCSFLNLLSTKMSNTPNMDRIAEGIVTDIQSNPLLMYLATEMALMETRIKQLEEDGRQHRATIVAQRLEMDQTNRQMIAMTNQYQECEADRLNQTVRLGRQEDVITLLQTRMDALQNAVNAYLYEHTTNERDEMLYFIEQEARMAGIDLTDIVDTEPDSMLDDLELMFE